MGDAARQDDYELPDAGAPLIGDGGQFSPGVGWANRLFDRLPKAVMGGLARTVETPGALMKPNPYPPGSEEADAYEAFKTQTATDWAPGMAMNTMGTGAIVGVPVKGGEMALGAGAVRKAKPKAEAMGDTLNPGNETGTIDVPVLGPSSPINAPYGQGRARASGPEGAVRGYAAGSLRHQPAGPA